MKLHLINTGFFKLDGGAMFGVVPKSIWNKTNPADSNNLCTWAMRSLLVEQDNQIILIDSGIGNKLPQSFLKHYELQQDKILSEALQQADCSSDQITDHILTHLHFDHCGGSTIFNSTKDKIEPTFKNANYWIHSQHWQWATVPNPREKASFLDDNLLPLKASGQLNYIEEKESNFNNFSFLYVDGHTDKQTIPYIQYKDKLLIFAADLLPSVGHIPLPYVMGYDTRPLLTMDEKAKFLNEAADKEYIIILQHDPVNECCTVQHTDKGVRLKETFKLSDVI
jgi:glyoxylase-like metal-dependent hydrolase (beta-lactamase superfamily II)